MGVGGVTSNDCLMLQFCTSKIQKKKNIPKNSSKFHAADTHGIAPMDPPVAEKVLKVEQTRQKKNNKCTSVHSTTTSGARSTLPTFLTL